MLNDWRNRILSSWGYMKILRLALASVVLIEAWKTSEPVFALFGGILFLQALLNIGCCGTGRL